MRFLDWGAIDYSLALDQQLKLVEDVANGGEEVIVFCSHPSIVTLGRKSSASDILGWTGPVLEVNRGGRATYHGPKQLVIYPILNLKRSRQLFPAQDLHKYLKAIETLLIDVVSNFGIQATGGFEKKETGVWVVQKKLASIGIGVKRWVSFHGAALNIGYDPIAFTGIKPCGFTTETMTSLEEILGCAVDRGALKASVVAHFKALGVGGHEILS